MTTSSSHRVQSGHLPVSKVAHAAAVLLILGVAAPASVAAVPDKVTYDDHVLPIFREHCLACHDAGGRSADLSLESYADAMTGGASGEVVDPGSGDASRLYRVMAHLEKPIMPPGSDKLPDDQLALVKAWIDGGLLENAGSKAKKSNKPKVEAFVPSADNRPTGEPAMPSGFYREPVLHASHEGAVADLATSPWAPLLAVTGQGSGKFCYTTPTRMNYWLWRRSLSARPKWSASAAMAICYSWRADWVPSWGWCTCGTSRAVNELARLATNSTRCSLADILADHSLVGLRRAAQASASAPHGRRLAGLQYYQAHRLGDGTRVQSQRRAAGHRRSGGQRPPLGGQNGPGCRQPDRTQDGDHLAQLAWRFRAAGYGERRRRAAYLAAGRQPGKAVAAWRRCAGCHLHQEWQPGVDLAAIDSPSCGTPTGRSKPNSDPPTTLAWLWP